jgi:hypothetical protein
LDDGVITGADELLPEKQLTIRLNRLVPPGPFLFWLLGCKCCKSHDLSPKINFIVLSLLTMALFRCRPGFDYRLKSG